MCVFLLFSFSFLLLLLLHSSFLAGFCRHFFSWASSYIITSYSYSWMSAYDITSDSFSSVYSSVITSYSFSWVSSSVITSSVLIRIFPRSQPKEKQNVKSQEKPKRSQRRRQRNPGNRMRSIIKSLKLVNSKKRKEISQKQTAVSIQSKPELFYL